MIEAYDYFTTMPGCVIGALVLLNLAFSIINYWQTCRLSAEERVIDRPLLTAKGEPVSQEQVNASFNRIGRR